MNRKGVTDNDKGKVSDILFSNYLGVSGDAALATITLQAVLRGKSNLGLSESELNPFASGGKKIEVVFGKSAVNVVRN